MDVLITHYQQRTTLRDSISSIESQLSDDDTIYVVDAGSTDGSFHILESLDAEEQIELIYVDGVSRGRGRQIAFEESNADIVIAHADLDAIFYPILDDLADIYQKVRSERGSGLLLAHGCFVSDRQTIRSVGGWNDLQVHEDKDLWIRAEGESRLYQMPISVVKSHSNFEWDSLRYRLKRQYQNYRDAIRLGISPSLLRKSYREHQPISSWPIDSAIVSIAARNAADMATYDTLENINMDPSRFHLRELTFRALVENGAINPTVLDVPENFTNHQSERAFPGRTSYH